MKNLADVSVEDLTRALALKLAADEFETNRDVWANEVEVHNVVAEQDYVESGVQSLEWYCNEQLVESVWDVAKAEYAKLCEVTNLK